MRGGTAAAGGIALVNSFGNLGGYLGPFAIGWLKDATGEYAAGLQVLAVAMGLAGALVLLVGKQE
jgi:ACS family tartrate transporter-like MFS transporter